MTDWIECEVVSRKGYPCKRQKGHENSEYPFYRKHEWRVPDNEDTPRMRQFRAIVQEGLDRGVQYSYLEIARRMGHPNLASVEHYGLGSRYTRLRQKMFKEQGIKPVPAGSKVRRAWSEAEIVAELREAGKF